MLFSVITLCMVRRDNSLSGGRASGSTDQLLPVTFLSCFILTGKLSRNFQLSCDHTFPTHMTIFGFNIYDRRPRPFSRADYGDKFTLNTPQTRG